jgi:hypothetical protein
MKMNKIYMGLVVAAGLLASCKNNEVVYPDFDYSTVYFASQYPLRTLELGEDLLVDNTMDNQRKVEIKATMGGVYENKKNVVIDVVVDGTLLNNLYYNNGGSKIELLPSQYYQLASNQITIPAGSILGGVVVQLTDAFFADPKSLGRNYVIPLVMTKASGVDSILRGKPLVNNPSPFVNSNWATRPKNYVLYGIKYVNPWHGNYLRKGIDQITNANGSVTSAIRHTPYVENNQVVNISTGSLKVANLPLTIKNTTGNNVTVNLLLTFADNGTCTVSTTNVDFDISGTGKFISNGEKNSIGGSDRSAIYLDYNLLYKTQNIRYSTKDTLIVRDRGLKAEYFDVEKK